MEKGATIRKSRKKLLKDYLKIHKYFVVKSRAEVQRCFNLVLYVNVFDSIIMPGYAIIHVREYINSLLPIV